MVARQFAAIVLLSLMGILFFRGVGWVERSLLRGHIAIREETGM
jgi:ABC-type nitrate/sulfonate/bicarbonate transport system permease component